jgi:hypothetical protein
MPAAAQHTFGNTGLVPFYRPELAVVQHVKLNVSATYVKGTVLGEVTATPGLFGLYADAGAGGLDTARAILAYDCVVDASGNITLGGGEHGQTQLSAPAFFSGWFLASELTGLTAAAVVDLGRLISGSVSSGILRVE